MNDRFKTRPALIRELHALRRRVASGERRQGEAGRTGPGPSEKDETGPIRAEEALKESEARFRNLMEFIPSVSIQGYRTDGRVVYWNRASETVYGYKAHEAIGKNLADLIIPPGLRPLFEECLARGAACVESGELFPPGELTLQRKDGSPVPVYSIHTVVCVKGSAPLLFCIDMDLSEQRRREGALRESEARYRFLAEKVADIAFTADMNLATTYVSPSIENVLGFTPEERKAQAIDRQLTPETLKMIAETLAVELAREKLTGTDPDRSITLTLQCYHKDGSIRHLETHFRGVRDDAGRLTGFSGLQHDVTERKKHEEELRQSEMKYRDLAELLPQVVFETDLTGNLTFVNRMGYALFDYSLANRNANMSVFDLIAPQDRARAAERAASIMSGQPGTGTEFTAIRADGAQFPVIIYAAPILRDGRATGMRGTLIDITERKHIEEILRESEDRYRMIFQHSNDVIYTVNRDFLILSVSPSVERLLGYSPEEFIGRPLGEIDILSPEDHERAFFEMSQVFAGGRFSASEYAFIAKNGRRLIGEVSGAPLVKEGVIVGLISVARDITARKQMEKEKEVLEAQNHQLQKTESLHRMAGAVAHHFNNRLGVVIGNLELAMDERRDEGGRSDGLTAAMEAAKKAAELSGLMLTYLGHSFEKRERLDLAEACRRVLPRLRAAMPKKALLEADLPLPGPAVLANEDLIEQLLTCLLTNGWEALGEAAGALRLRVGTTAASDIPAARRFPADWQPQGADYACLKVADTGCGITEADMANLFDPFFSRKFTGRGLGLSVVLGIVRAHGGAVAVQSEPGRGSSFTVFLPICAP